jgi:glycosyltransferase involved in cell wall biosynthesis
LKILLIAPQPFFEGRGTPISVDLLARALCHRGDQVDLLTTHLGENRSYPGLNLIRVTPPLAPKRIPPGPSLAKYYCDLFILIRSLWLSKRGGYDVVHAIEEGSFMAWLANIIGGTPYVVDIDSSMTTQIVGRHRSLRRMEKALTWFEQLPLKRAIAAVAVCDALAADARRLCKGETVVIPDVTLPAPPGRLDENIREIIQSDLPIVMYVGNLEPYQGIDFLLESFSIFILQRASAHLVLIGGAQQQIKYYENKAEQLNIGKWIHFLGPRPVRDLHGYLRQADVLVSPRIEGVNTPMKIYSYMDSGRPLVATDIVSHSQVLDNEVAFLSLPEPYAFASALRMAVEKKETARKVAAAAKALVVREHTPAIFIKRVHSLYDRIESSWIAE